MSAASHFWSAGPLAAAGWIVLGWTLLCLGLTVLFIVTASAVRRRRRDRREADHAASLPAGPPPVIEPRDVDGLNALVATAALTPDALPDAVPVIPGPAADPARVIADAIDHLASGIAATRLGCEPHIATQWQARAARQLHRLDADQLTDQLLTALAEVAAKRADALLHPAPAHPQES